VSFSHGNLDLTMRLDLKFAIIRSGKSQRAVSVLARIPEGRLSDLVRGYGWPTAAERAALAEVLGGDFFTDVPVGAEVRARRSTTW
jgi:hypothetical protein